MHLPLTLIDALSQKETNWRVYRRIAPATVVRDLREIADKAIRLARYLERQEPEKSPNREAKRLPMEIGNRLTVATNGSGLESETASAPVSNLVPSRVSFGFPWSAGPSRR